MVHSTRDRQHAPSPRVMHRALQRAAFENTHRCSRVLPNQEHAGAATSTRVSVSRLIPVLHRADLFLRAPIAGVAFSELARENAITSPSDRTCRIFGRSRNRPYASTKLERLNENLPFIVPAGEYLVRPTVGFNWASLYII